MLQHSHAPEILNCTEAVEIHAVATRHAHVSDFGRPLLMLVRIARHPPQIQRIIDDLDIDNNGKIEWSEFASLSAPRRRA